MTGHDLTPKEIGAVQLRFTEFTVYVVVDSDDDTLVCIRDETDPRLAAYRHPIAGSFWAPFVGRSLTDAWQMVNHRGYWDGLQLEFRDSPVSEIRSIVQLYSEGSQITLLELSVTRRDSSAGQ
jgi:hypothetical protein